MSGGHTPGPWSLGREWNGYVAIDALDGSPARHVTQWRELATVVLHVDDEMDDDRRECEANARLIAAAPDLMAACEAYIAAYDGATGTVYVVDQIRSAITKARGEA